MQYRYLAFWAIIVCLFTGCGAKKQLVEAEKPQPSASDAAGNTSDLQGIWYVIEIQNTSWPDGLNRADLRFEEASGRINGNGGCNSYFGNFSRDTKAISFSSIGSTKMYCEASSKLESRFFETLSQVDGYLLKGHQLLLSQGKETVLVLQRDNNIDVTD